MPRMFYTEDGTIVKYGETDGVSENVPDKTEIDGGAPSEDDGKNFAGIDPSLIVSPFSAKSENSAGYPELLDNDEMLAMNYGEYTAHKHFQRKYTETNKHIVSNENMPAEPEQRVRGAYCNVIAGSHDPLSVRGLAIDAPVFQAGFGISSSGVPFKNDVVGPVDQVWDKKRQMWRERIAFPAVGRVVQKKDCNPFVSDGTSSLYTIEIIGAKRETKNPNDLEKLTVERTVLVGESQKLDASGSEPIVYTELEDVFNIGEKINGPLLTNSDERATPDFKSGDIVTVFYDAFNDMYCCYKEMPDVLLCKKDESLTIPAGAAMEITGTEGVTRALIVVKPTANNLDNSIVLISPNYEIEGGNDVEYFFTKANYTSFANTSDLLNIGDDAGTRANDWFLEENQTGFKCISGVFGGYAYVRPFSFAVGLPRFQWGSDSDIFNVISSASIQFATGSWHDIKSDSTDLDISSLGGGNPDIFIVGLLGEVVATVNTAGTPIRFGYRLQIKNANGTIYTGYTGPSRPHFLFYQTRGAISTPEYFNVMGNNVGAYFQNVDVGTPLSEWRIEFEWQNLGGSFDCCIHNGYVSGTLERTFILNVEP